MAAAEPSAEFYHRWGTKGELKALDAISQALAKKGVKLDALRADDKTNAAIKAQLASGDTALALKMHGQDLLSWSKQADALADVGQFKGAATWKAALPKALLPFMSDGDKLHGVPIGMHRANSLWANKAVFEKLGVKVPTSWEEFNLAAEKFKAAGITPLALGGQAWQEGTVFESVVLGIGGPDFYRAALIRNDPAALQSATMQAVFKQMRLLSGMVDAGYDNRSWTDTAAMVTRGEAAMQIMGEWVKSEYLQAGLKPNRDFLCFPAPGTQGSFVFLSDFIGVFNAGGAAAKKSSEALVSVVMNKDVQKKFNLSKGSIPSRLDVGGSKFDACAQAAMADRKQAIRSNTMLGSLTYQHATTDAVKDAMLEVVHQHFHSRMADDAAVKLLAEKVAAAHGV